jgi:hypothetical protein
MRWREWLLVVTLVLIAITPTASGAIRTELKKADRDKANAVVASQLMLFASYVTTSTNAAATATNLPIVLCVAADDELLNVIRLTAEQQRSRRPIQVRTVAKPEDVGPGQILFIGGDQRESDWLAGVANKGVLTIGESGRTAEAGGVIGLVLDKGRMRYDINRAAGDRAGLRISSAVFEHARKVLKGEI